jgi:hypothetical protein
VSHVFPNARKLAWTGALDLSTATIVAALVRPTSTAATEIDADVVADFTTLDETAVSGYTRQTLASVSVDDPGTGPVSLLADDLDFGVLDEGAAESIGGILLLVDNGGPSSDVPLAFLDGVQAASISFPYHPTSKQFLVEWLNGVVLEL